MPEAWDEHDDEWATPYNPYNDGNNPDNYELEGEFVVTRRMAMSRYAGVLCGAVGFGIKGGALGRIRTFLLTTGASTTTAAAGSASNAVGHSAVPTMNTSHSM